MVSNTIVLILKIGKMGHFKKIEHRKVGHFEKKARDQFNFSHLILKTENGPKMSIFDFGAFRKKMHMPSPDKFLFHMPFGAFHITPRILTYHPLLVIPTIQFGT